MNSEAEGILEPAPPLFVATVKRRILAVYFDMVIFGAMWFVVAYFVEQALSIILPGYAQIISFVVVEILAYRVAVSPGFALLSIYPIQLERGQEGKGKRILLVDPRIKPFETWLGMITASLFLLDGAKSLARWTLGLPALPLFGYATPVVNIAAGIVYFIIAYYIFKSRKRGTRMAFAWMAAWVFYVCVMWNRWGQWFLGYQRARRELSGRPFPPERMEDLQKFVDTYQGLMPISLVIGAGICAILIYFVHRKMRYE